MLHWHVPLRSSLTVILAMCLLLCAGLSCQHGAGGGAVTKPDKRLPQDWPLPELRLPRDAKVFEGQVNPDHELEDGRVVDQYAAFFTSGLSWEDMQAQVEDELAPLAYRVVELPPDAVPATGGAQLSFKSVYASEDGFMLVTLTYEVSPMDPADTGLPKSYFSIQLERRHEALPPSDDWPQL